MSGRKQMINGREIADVSVISSNPDTGTGAEGMLVVIKWPELVAWLPSVKYGH